MNASISFWVSLVFSTSPDWPLSLTISMMGKSMNGKSPSEVLQEGSIIVMMGSPQQSSCEGYAIPTNAASWNFELLFTSLTFKSRVALFQNYVSISRAGHYEL